MSCRCRARARQTERRSQTQRVLLLLLQLPWLLQRHSRHCPRSCRQPRCLRRRCVARWQQASLQTWPSASIHRSQYHPQAQAQAPPPVLVLVLVVHLLAVQVGWGGLSTAHRTAPSQPCTLPPPSSSQCPSCATGKLQQRRRQPAAARCCCCSSRSTTPRRPMPAPRRRRPRQCQQTQQLQTGRRARTGSPPQPSAALAVPLAEAAARAVAWRCPSARTRPCWCMGRWCAPSGRTCGR